VTCFSVFCVFFWAMGHFARSKLIDWLIERLPDMSRLEVNSEDRRLFLRSKHSIQNSRQSNWIVFNLIQWPYFSIFNSNVQLPFWQTFSHFLIIIPIFRQRTYSQCQIYLFLYFISDVADTQNCVKISGLFKVYSLPA